jgi:hypothetical protein
MAGDWIKMEMELSDKPEVHYIANALTLDPDAVVGKLFRVWSWFNKHTVDGNAHGVTFLLVDRICGVTGFGEAMSFAGWLEQRDKVLHMPNFEYHTSESAKKRALTAKRVANHKAKSNAEGNAASVTSALPREEKRRDKTPLPPSGAFLRFWGAWPSSARKASRGECWAKWLKQDFDQVAEQIVSHVEAMKQTQDWRKDSGSFIPAPLAYLNQRRWEGADLAAIQPHQDSPLYSRQGPM